VHLGHHHYFDEPGPLQKEVRPVGSTDTEVHADGESLPLKRGCPEV
jgi:hypothetical protein